MNCNIKDIRKLLVNAWGKITSTPKADYIAEAIIRAALSKDSRMNPLKESLHDLKSSLEAAPIQKMVVDLGSTCVLDYGGTSPFGHLADIHQLLRDRSAKYGIASIALRNTAGIHQLSTWVEPLSRDGDLLSLFAWNGGSYTVAPFGSMEPFFGTNPIAFAIPTAEDPIICDMATSEVPFLSLMQALRSSSDLDRVAGLDQDGKRTNKSKDIYDPEIDGPVRLLPMGLGYKGSAIMLLIEVVTGALIGAKMGREANDQKFTPSEFGGWLVTINIASLTDVKDFKNRVTLLSDQIRKSKPAQDIDNILLPGDRAHSNYSSRLNSGKIEITNDDFNELSRLAH